MRKTPFATQWAAKNEKGNDEPEIPEEYRWHATVFSEEAAKQFPPSCKESMAIKFIPGALSNIDCKVLRVLWTQRPEWKLAGKT
jgi:hypothetical protein